MRIIFILLFTTQVGCATFWIGFGSHVAGDLATEQYKKMKKEKEKKEKALLKKTAKEEAKKEEEAELLKRLKQYQYQGKMMLLLN